MDRAAVPSEKIGFHKTAAADGKNWSQSRDEVLTK